MKQITTEFIESLGYSLVDCGLYENPENTAYGFYVFYKEDKTFAQQITISEPMKTFGPILKTEKEVLAAIDKGIIVRSISEKDIITT